MGLKGQQPKYQTDIQNLQRNFLQSSHTSFTHCILQVKRFLKKKQSFTVRSEEMWLKLRQSLNFWVLPKMERHRPLQTWKFLRRSSKRCQSLCLNSWKSWKARKVWRKAGAKCFQSLFAPRDIDWLSIKRFQKTRPFCLPTICTIQAEIKTYRNSIQSIFMPFLECFF